MAGQSDEDLIHAEATQRAYEFKACGTGPYSPEGRGAGNNVSHPAPNPLMHVAVIFPRECPWAGEVSGAVSPPCPLTRTVSGSEEALVETERVQRIWSRSPGDTFAEFEVLEMLVHVCAGISPPLERLLAAIWPDALECFLLGHLAGL